jgi:hypothetical protein
MDLRTLPHSETISGFTFIATPEEVAVMDILVGPTRPMLPTKRGGRRVMVRDCVIPDRSHIWFLDVLVSVISPATHELRLELVTSDGAVALYRYPSQAIDILSKLTPDRADFVLEEIGSIAERAMEHPEIRERYREGGVRGALLTMRGDALKAVPRGSGKEVYYWCYRKADAGRLHPLQP